MPKAPPLADLVPSEVELNHFFPSPASTVNCKSSPHHSSRTSVESISWQAGQDNEHENETAKKSSRVESVLDAYADSDDVGSDDGEDPVSNVGETSWDDPGDDQVFFVDGGKGRNDGLASDALTTQGETEYDSSVWTNEGYLERRLFEDLNIDLTLTVPPEYPPSRWSASGKSSPTLSDTSIPSTLLFPDGIESAWSPYSTPSPPRSPKFVSWHPVVEVASIFPLRSGRSRSTISSRPTISSLRTVSFQYATSADTTRSKIENKLSRRSIVSTFKSKFRRAQPAVSGSIIGVQTNVDSFLDADELNSGQSLHHSPNSKPVRREHSYTSNSGSSGSSDAEVICFITPGKKSADYSTATMELSHYKSTPSRARSTPVSFPSPTKSAERGWCISPPISTERRPSKALPERPLSRSPPPLQHFIPRKKPAACKKPAAYTPELRAKTSRTRGIRSAPESPVAGSVSFVGYRIIPKRAGDDGYSSAPSPILKYSLASKLLPPVDHRYDRFSSQPSSPVVPKKDFLSPTTSVTYSSEFYNGGLFRNRFQA